MKTPIGITDGKVLNKFNKEKALELFLESKEELPRRPIDIRVLAKQNQLFKTDEEFNKFMTDFGIRYSKKKIKTLFREDRLVIQSVEAIADLDKIVNLLSERLAEWFSLHHPEFTEENHEKFAESVVKYGNRKKFPGFKESFGQDLRKEDEAILKKYARQICEMYNLREELKRYVDKQMKRVAPNLEAVAGGLLGARLISLSGGLERLAKKPASTIQLLGAEKALFRFLRGRGKAPKYGLIFSHPLVQSVPESKRGKVSRLLAAKIMLAARLDFYGKKNKGKEIKRELEKHVRLIR